MRISDLLQTEIAKKVKLVEERIVGYIPVENKENFAKTLDDAHTAEEKQSAIQFFAAIAHQKIFLPQDQRNSVRVQLRSSLTSIEFDIVLNFIKDCQDVAEF